MMNKKILVLMSTYNGEQYLKLQLDSILAQENVRIALLIRDDGSQDSTKQILRNYRERFPEQIFLLFGENVGCKKSFFFLIQHAARQFGTYDYYAFADQDDVWLKNKIYLGVVALDKEDNPYRMYYCDPMLVDESLNRLFERHYKAKGTLEESFILQPCLGCTMVFSSELLFKFALSDPERSDIHDSWCYRVNLALGGVICYDSKCLILYRQHQQNCIGGKQTFKAKWSRRFTQFVQNNQLRSRHAKEIKHVYAEWIPFRTLKILDELIEYKNSLYLKFRIVFSARYMSNKVLHNILFRISILTNRI